MAKHTRKDTDKPKHRHHCSWYVIDRIETRTCFHVDVWLQQDSDNRLYFIVETNTGGHHRLSRGSLLVDGDRLVQTDYVPDGIARYVNTPWCRKYAPHLEALAKREIMPSLRKQREGYKTVSIMLHYIKQPEIDPVAGLVNYYDSHSRTFKHTAAKLARQREGEIRPSVIEATAPQLSKADKSILRTLQKLLG